jgi:hypothetical protein
VVGVQVQRTDAAVGGDEGERQGAVDAVVEAGPAEGGVRIHAVDGDVAESHDPLLAPGVEARPTSFVVLGLVDLGRLLVGEDRRRHPFALVEEGDPDERGGGDGADGERRHPVQGVPEGRVGHEEPGQHPHRLC